MAEQLILTSAIPTTTLWRAQLIVLYRGLTNVGAVTAEPSASRITVGLVGDNGRTFSHTWFGTSANDDLIALNKANLSTISLEKRLFNRLIADDIQVGTVSGSPD